MLRAYLVLVMGIVVLGPMGTDPAGAVPFLPVFDASNFVPGAPISGHSNGYGVTMIPAISSVS